MKYRYELWFEENFIYSFKRKKDLLAYWDHYKKENNIVGKKALIKRIEIRPFHGC